MNNMDDPRQQTSSVQTLPENQPSNIPNTIQTANLPTENKKSDRPLINAIIASAIIGALTTFPLMIFLFLDFIGLNGPPRMTSFSDKMMPVIVYVGWSLILGIWPAWRMYRYSGKKKPAIIILSLWPIVNYVASMAGISVFFAILMALDNLHL